MDVGNLWRLFDDKPEAGRPTVSFRASMPMAKACTGRTWGR